MFENILTYDVIGLAARLRNIVMDNKRQNFLLARRDMDAQFLLDLLQAVCLYFFSLSVIHWCEGYVHQRLDFYTDPELKKCIVHLLIKLSRASGLYPRSLVLEGVTRNDYPVARGGYGEVHRGEFQGREVAVKVLKIYKNSDMGALLKVVQLSSPAHAFWTMPSDVLVWSCHMAAARSSQYLTVLRCELWTNGVPSVALVGQWEPCRFFGQASSGARLCPSGKLYNQLLALFRWHRNEILFRTVPGCRGRSWVST